MDPDQSASRCLWIAKATHDLITGPILGDQAIRVRQALKRFVVGGPYTIVTAEARDALVMAIGDIRELKVDGPNFCEFRFKPPQYDFRMFGSFVGLDSMVVTSHGMKALGANAKGHRPLSVAQERTRRDGFFSLCALAQTDALPQGSEYMTNVKYSPAR